MARSERQTSVVGVAMTTFLVGAVGLAGVYGYAFGADSGRDGTSARAATPAVAPARVATKHVHAESASATTGTKAMSMNMAAAPAKAPAGKGAARTAPYGSTPLATTVENGWKVFHMTAKVARWRIDDKTDQEVWAYDGQVPGPLVRLRVGDKVKIVLKNELPEPTTVHWHGLDIPLSQDGVLDISQKPVPPGATFTYSFVVPNQPGTYMYHPHYDTLKQQSMGLSGALIVDPRTGPDRSRQEIVQVLSEMGGKYLINGKSYPATDAYNVKMGVPVRIRLVNVGEMGHPMHLHGFSFRQVAENGSPVAPKEQRRMFTQMVQPGETYEEEYTPDRPGAWLFHCHILSHVTDANGGDTGMITPIVAG